jgi:hypothetical protein
LRTKNAAPISAEEREHLAAVKSQPCAVCDQAGPSDAHHITQGAHFTAVALCKDCHQGGFNGWHGQRRMWTVRKLDELGALNITLGRLFSGIRHGKC